MCLGWKWSCEWVSASACQRLHQVCASSPQQCALSTSILPHLPQHMCVQTYSTALARVFCDGRRSSVCQMAIFWTALHVTQLCSQECSEFGECSVIMALLSMISHHLHNLQYLHQMPHDSAHAELLWASFSCKIETTGVHACRLRILQQGPQNVSLRVKACPHSLVGMDYAAVRRSYRDAVLVGLMRVGGWRSWPHAGGWRLWWPLAGGWL